MIIKEDMQRTLLFSKKPATTLTLDEKIDRLYKKEYFKLPLALEIYKDIVKKDVESYPKVLEPRKQEIHKTMNRLFVFESFEKAETYFAATLKKKLAEFEKGSSRTPFWDILNSTLEKIFELGNLEVSKTIQQNDRVLFNAPDRMLSDLPAYAEQTIIHLFDLSKLMKICKKNKGQFLHYYNQSTHPHPECSGFVCTGLVFHWGKQLFSNPPKEKASPSYQVSRLVLALRAIKKETFDAIQNDFPLTYIRYGEPVYDSAITQLHTLSYIYLKGHELIIPTVKLKICLGKHAARESVSLFAKDEKQPVSMVSLTLSNPGRCSHVIGIVQIKLANQETCYRMLDAEEGEFELYSSKTLISFLDDFFHLNEYTRYSSVSISNIDSYFFTLPSLSNPYQEDPPTPRMSPSTPRMSPSQVPKPEQKMQSLRI